MQQRVVITGIGAITSLGDAPKLWTNLLDGVSGIAAISSFDTGAFPVKIASEVKDFRPEEYLDRKEARRMDRFCQFAVAAAEQCLTAADYDVAANAERTGVLVGSGIGGIQTLEEQCGVLMRRGVDRVSPFFVPMLIPDMASGLIAIRTGAKGPNSCTVTACATGTHSIGDAFRIIARGDADAMLAGGTEAAVSPLGMAGFVAARALSTNNEAPQKASRPFDAHRDGFVMGEGAAILLLESLEFAQKRQAPIIAEIVGYGSSADAYHITSPAPEGEGAQRAMKAALADAKLMPEAIDYINAHGTSTEYNDRCETQAIKAVFGDHARKLAISSTKSLTGHLLGAAGAVEAAVAAFSLRDSIVHGTYNYDTVDPDCDLDYVPNASRTLPLQFVMSNSFGFGGHNGVLVFKRWDAR